MLSEVRKYGLPFIRLGHKRGSLKGDKGSFYCLVNGAYGFLDYGGTGLNRLAVCEGTLCAMH